MHYARTATLRLIWVNFKHLFVVSLVPFTTMWIADTQRAGVAVSFDAGIFLLVNLSDFWLIVEIFSRNTMKNVSISTQRRMRIRLLCTLATCSVSMCLAPAFPI